MNNISNVKIIDFDMSFRSMVIFMVKWTVASIPSILILFIFWMLLMYIFGGTIDWSITL